MKDMPEPNEQGHYNLPCGSIIYPSGKSFDRVDKNGIVTGHVDMPDAGRFMLWIKTGTRKEGGRTIAVGEFVMNSDGPRYFDAPENALEHLARRKGSQ